MIKNEQKNFAVCIYLSPRRFVSRFFLCFSHFVPCECIRYRGDLEKIIFSPSPDGIGYFWSPLSGSYSRDRLAFAFSSSVQKLLTPGQFAVSKGGEALRLGTIFKRVAEKMHRSLKPPRPSSLPRLVLSFFLETVDYFILVLLSRSIMGIHGFFPTRAIQLCRCYSHF